MWHHSGDLAYAIYIDKSLIVVIHRKRGMKGITTVGVQRKGGGAQMLFKTCVWGEGLKFKRNWRCSLCHRYKKKLLKKASYLYFTYIPVTVILEFCS